MDYTYNIIDEVYNWMKSKKKTVEVRILKEKSQAIQPGDYITFYHIDDNAKYIKVRVVNKNIVNTVDELFNLYPVEVMMPDHTEEDLKELLNEIYGDLLKDSKLVAIEFTYLT